MMNIWQSRLARTFVVMLWLGVSATGGSLNAAQQAPLPPGAQPAAPQTPPPAPSAVPSVDRITLTAGRSTVLQTDFDITRIAVTNPAIADATVVAPREVLIDGKAPGTISLIMWGVGQRVQYDLVVDPGVGALQQQLRGLFPGEDISVTVNDEATTLSGRVSSNAVMLKAGEIAEKTSSKSKVINLLRVPGGIESQQVMLQVRFAEVNRSALTEAGISLFTGALGEKDFIARTSTQQFSAPSFTNSADSSTLTFSDFLNLFVFNTKYQVGAVIKALQTKGLIQSLAEPNLIAYNGQEASFLAGGEVPVPIVQGGVASSSVTVSYKEFGIRLTFKPTIAGDVIRLHVKPEVSSLDFANGVTLSGFRIPALIVRRAETEVELRDGQSFAIAGLLDNVTQTDTQAVPVLGSLPIIGNLFKSKSDRLARTELMVLITPRLVRALDPDEVPALPTMPERFLKTGQDIGSQLEGGGGVVDGPGPQSDKDAGKAPKK
jgi:pilus assembly protein CpaC